jgi:ubiquinone/menaquinone biosynthesis C-methylase UbiE
LSLRDKVYRQLYPDPRPENPFDIRYRTLAKTAKRILDLGAGRGASAKRVASKSRMVVGSDLDRAVAGNQTIDHAVLSSGEQLPFNTSSFDLCVMRWVVEHLPSPEATFREVCRVLTPGGRLLLLTPNLYFYVYALAFVLPNRWHPSLVRLTSGREERDVFPTLYRANTPQRLGTSLKKAGFSNCSVRGFQDGPSYLGFSLPTLLVGAAYDRFVNLSPLFEGLRQGLIGEAEKV